MCKAAEKNAAGRSSLRRFGDSAQAWRPPTKCCTRTPCACSDYDFEVPLSAGIGSPRRTMYDVAMKGLTLWLLLTVQGLCLAAGSGARILIVTDLEGVGGVNNAETC